VRGHARFDPDQAWSNVHKSCSKPVPREFLAQNDGASLTQAYHVKRVLAGVDPNRADICGICLGGMVCSSRSPKGPKQTLWVVRGGSTARHFSFGGRLPSSGQSGSGGLWPKPSFVHRFCDMPFIRVRFGSCIVPAGAGTGSFSEYSGPLSFFQMVLFDRML